MSCTNDILGNRLTKGTASYGWDVLNRMTSYASGGITTSYTYRADGMRVSKSDSTGSAVYRYDGQMCMQDVETVGSTVTTTNYALGARGIDAVSKTENGTTSVGYPIYDAHGNRVATLTKSGTSFSLTDIRTYDAWGNVRVGAQTGRPRARYCANLGHVQDDESGLVYMRARYYEPTSGRFVSEDPTASGRNWFIYSSDNPTNAKDVSGCFTFLDDLISDLTGMINDLRSGGVSTVAKRWSFTKLEDIFAYTAGYYCGLFVAMELEEGGISAYENGMSIGYGQGGTGINFDFDKSHWGYEHIDMQGKLGRFQNDFKKMFGMDRIPMDLFLSGFVDGFF